MSTNFLYFIENFYQLLLQHRHDARDQLLLAGDKSLEHDILHVVWKLERAQRRLTRLVAKAEQLRVLLHDIGQHHKAHLDAELPELVA